MSNKHEASLRFLEYFVSSINYKLNENFNNDAETNLEVDFDVTSRILIDEQRSSVHLDAVVGEEGNPNCPFIIEASIVGLFEFEGNFEENKDFLTSNAVAVLFPYLRSVISDVSVKSNIFPNYLLPLINISKYIKDNDKVKVFYKNDNQ